MNPRLAETFMGKNGSPRILITRLGAIGDTILTLPVLCALRRHFPHAFLAWLVEPAAAPMVQGHACVDQVIVARRRWLKSLTEIGRLRRELRALELDLVIDPQSLTKSALAGWLSGVQRRIGFASPQGREISLWLNNEFVNPVGEHLVDRQLELLTPLGITQPIVEFRLPASPTAPEKILQFIREAHLGRGFSVVNPGAGWTSRLWVLERFGKLARHLGETWNLPTVVTWAGERERRMAEKILTSSGGHGILAPSTQLLELAELVRQAEIFIGCDSGPMHMAVAVNTTCVALHGTTRWQHSGPYGNQHLPVQDHFQTGTSRQRRTADNLAMQAISVESVCRACDQILERKRKRNGLRCAA